MASYKDYKTVAAAKKAGSLYFMGKDGKKKLAVTAETLNAWKKKNKGMFKGSALTAWANNKGKNIKPSISLRPKKRPGSGLSSTTKARARETAEVKKANEENRIAREQKGGSAASIIKIVEEALGKKPNNLAYNRIEKALKETDAERKKRLAKERQANYDRARKAAKPQKPGTRSGNSKGGMMKKKKGYAKGGAIKRTKR